MMKTLKHCSQTSRRFILMLVISFSTILFGETIQAQASNQAQNDFSLIMDRIKADRLNRSIASTEKSIDYSLTLMQADGSFSDIDYASQVRTNWPPITHLDRVREIIIGYGQTSNKYYNQENIYNKIVQALELWYVKKPKSSNWWYQQVATAQRMGELLIAMRYAPQQLSAELEGQLLSYMASVGGDPKNQAGANKLDLAIHWIYRACLEAKADNLKYATDQAFYPLRYTNAEGFQYDGSYFQHGPQLYIGGYGRVTISGSVSVAQYMVDTPYALSGAPLELLSSFVRNTYVKTIRGRYHLYNILGRGMTRQNALSQAGFAGILENIKKIDITHKDEYEKIILRLKEIEPSSYGIQPSNTEFWRGEYMLHQRPGYTFDVRLASKRIARNENGNGENLKGFFLSDGGTDIAIEGNEYANILPVWDWARIPGTTTPAMTTIPIAPSYIYYGRTNFAGGVSDGMYGVSGYSLFNDQFNINTYGQKSWFFFDKEIICLGAGIHSTASETINTSVNQCLLKGDIIASQKGVASSLTQGLVSRNNPDWVLHNKIAYYFPQGGDVTMGGQTQTGSWYEINNIEPKGKVSENVFNLWINHGLKPTDAQYAYMVVPNINTAEEAQNYPLNQIEILANTDSVQAVWHKGLGIYGLIFFKEATFSSKSFSIHTDRGCALLLKNVETPEVTVHIADPTQSGANIKLRTDFPTIEGTRQLECAGRAFPYAGSTSRYKINNQTPSYVPDNMLDRNHIEVSEDTYVHGGTNANTNFGTLNVLDIKKDSPSYARETYLKFALASADTIRLHRIYIALRGESANLSADKVKWVLSHVKDNTWKETEITWNKRPMPDNVIATTPTPRPEEEILVDVTDYVLNEIKNGNDMISIHINANERAADGKSNAKIYSREAEDPIKRPRMIIETKRTEPRPPLNKEIIIASDDAYVNGGTSADKNFGAANTLIVKEDYTAYARETYLKFPISDIDMEHTEQIFMSLTVSNANVSAHTIQWIISQVEDNTWDEMSITWNKRPTPATILATIPTSPVGAEVLVDITSAIRKEQLKGNTTISLHIKGSMRASDGKSDAQFFSKESADPTKHPHLKVMGTTASVRNTTIDFTDNKLNPIYSIHPNPVRAGEVISVFSENNDTIEKLELRSMNGKLLAKVNGNQIATSGVPPGIYFLILQTKAGKTIYTEKLIIQ